MKCPYSSHVYNVLYLTIIIIVSLFLPYFTFPWSRFHYCSMCSCVVHYNIIEKKHVYVCTLHADCFIFVWKRYVSWVHESTRFVYVFHVSVLICVCVSACVPVSLMVPGGRPVSISRQQALVLCQSIDGPPVLDSRPLPTVTRWVYVWQCVNVCVIDI